LAQVLIGYDTESGCVVEASHEPLKTLEKSINALMNLHVEKQVPATFFIVGKTLEMGKNILRKLKEHEDLFDIQQHTYSHQPLKTINPKSDLAAVTNDFGVVAPRLSKIRSEIRKTNDLLLDILDVECTGIRGPWGYYQGLTGQPDILEILSENGISFSSTYLRNKDDFFPVSLSVQPFFYTKEGYPKILEIPSQDWIDCVWRTVYGWGRKTAFVKHISNVLKRLSGNMIWGTCFHDWSAIAYDSDARIMRTLIEEANERKIKINSYGGYHRQRRR
jgi:peptidoglycan/xylan/chitin deacetylase (PgdA/CDA1 family)